MKILIVTPYFPPHIGGAENSAYKIAKGLKEKCNWEIVVITTNYEKRERKEEIIDGLKIYRLPFWFKISNTPINPMWLFSIHKILKEERPDIIKTHSPVPFISDITFLIAGKIPLLMTYHSGSMMKPLSIWNPLIFIYELIFLPMLFRKSKKIICTSPKFMRQNLNKYKDKTNLVTPGVDTKVFKPSREKSTNDVLYIGRIEKNSDWKGIRFLIEAISIVKQIRPDINLRLVGAGDRVDHFKMYAQKLGISKNVKFVGSKIKNELLAEYQNSKIIVLPSITDSEQLPNVLLEAMACKKPVIASNVGGVPYAVDNGKNGLIVPPKDPQAIADAIIKILTNPQLAKKMGEEGREKVIKYFTWEKQINTTKELIEQILKRKTKIGIFHDTLTLKGGADRAIIELANHLDADLITSGFNPELRKWVDIKIKVIDIGNILIKYIYPIGFNLEAPLRFFLNRKKFDYDIYIFSLFSSIFAARPNKLNIWFCHTPNRILYDLREIRLKRANIIKKLFYKIYIKILYSRDQNIIKNNIQKIITNSKNVQTRVRKYYKQKAEVIYPPINTKKFKFKKFGDFYLAVSRLIPEKRIDLIAKAFIKLPNDRLIIVGDGPEKKKISKIIKNYKNIELLSNVDDRKLIELYSTCLATIYMPFNEDFGLVPLEGMASGKACIAANEGGCKETVINGKTGFLIEATEKNIINAIKKYNLKKAERMKEDCIKQSKKFDTKNYIKNWKRLIQNATK